MATEQKVDNSRPYTVKRLGQHIWSINEITVYSLQHALRLCEALDENRRYIWDFPTGGECEDGLQALKIGESLTVTYPEDE